MKAIKDKKGVMGLNVAKQFLVVLLALVIIGVTALIVFQSLGDSSAIDSTSTKTVNNETGAFINSTGYEFNKQGVGTISVIEARNASDGTVIGSGNYTVNNSADPIVLLNATTTTFSDVNIDYNYEVDSGEQNTIDNASSGISDFFANTGTWLSLLGVVILILIISAVIFVVNRFGGSNKGGSL
ncbi:MAG: hypothetical protein ABEI74_04755 [Candidatus Pacearchaeota archaeon]